ncbi:serine/threonine-protein kinase BLUS1-like [Carica papaya]|uniref:serine/threonine-protein kinase BLUS1-like n=1 Tax=Carica papaya TaxID=3649 RepID=UPI000B8C8F44|nr:serine/threonine-protein kinase BLUS1-like [Carica papaya]
MDIAHREVEERKKSEYPLAKCLPLDSTVLAVKAIDLDRSRADLDDIPRETRTMSLLSHPNILSALCSFTVDRHLWVVMPFMSSGSLHSIISSSFPDGLPEKCIAIVLKETLNALRHLHNQGDLHRDIKAGNILVDANGSVKLAGFSVSASIYESGTSSLVLPSSSMVFTDVAGMPYWIAPEVIQTGYSFKADIWSFGITALELAHGRPPLSSQSLPVNINKRFPFWDQARNATDKKFSNAFKKMVASCLDQDPEKRPTADKLLKHSFFKNCRGAGFLVCNLLSKLPSVEERFQEMKAMYRIGDYREDEDDSLSPSINERRIIGWNFNKKGLELDPVFAKESRDDEDFVQERTEGSEPVDDLKVPENIEIEEEGRSERAVSGTELRIGVNKEILMRGLTGLMASLEDQRQMLESMIGSRIREEQLTHLLNVLSSRLERLKIELEFEKETTFTLEMEKEFLEIQMSATANESTSST